MLACVNSWANFKLTAMRRGFYFEILTLFLLFNMNFLLFSTFIVLVSYFDILKIWVVLILLILLLRISVMFFVIEFQNWRLRWFFSNLKGRLLLGLTKMFIGYIFNSNASFLRRTITGRCCLILFGNSLSDR